jgi:hypothetical protein
MMTVSVSKAMHKRYLLVTAIVVGAFGPIFSLATMKDFVYPAALGMDLLSWPIDGQPEFIHPSIQFLTALTGGFLFGWGVTIFCLRHWVFDQAPEGVRKAVLVGLLAWFVLDSAGSIASGNASNAFFNIIVLLLAAGPLWFTAKDIHQPS